MAALLEVRDLHAGYGQTDVLHGLTFSVHQGGITALLGANGAGKTTALRSVCGMVKGRGQIRFAGEPINGRATEDLVRMGIAHVPEGRGTFAELTVEQNLRLSRLLNTSSPSRGGKISAWTLISSSSPVRPRHR